MTTSTQPAYYTDQSKQQHEIPDDLINLRIAWLAAEKAASVAFEPFPEGRALLGGAAATDEQVDRLAAARAELQRLTLEIHRHSWLATMDNRYLADQAMRAAAAARMAANPHASSSA